jgi:hypothetical protein
MLMFFGFFRARWPGFSRCLQLAAKGAMQQGLKQMFSLARGFALLAADAPECK